MEVKNKVEGYWDKFGQNRIRHMNIHERIIDEIINESINEKD